MRKTTAAALLFLALAPLATVRAGEDAPAAQAPAAPEAESSWWAVHADLDVIAQRHGSFASAWEELPAQGGNSFSSAPERSSSTMVGAAAGFRLGEGGELWFRGEGIRGIPLSAAGGLAGLTNNDMQRLTTVHLRPYRALTFVRWGWDLGEGEREAVEEDGTHFARSLSPRRIVVTAGKVDLLATFDDNDYSHKGTDEFLNWCFMTHCAYDFAADARGYAWGAGGELQWDAWSLRAGRYTMPQLPNQLDVDFHISRHHGDNLELGRRWQGGAVRLLAFHNVMPLSTYAGADNIAPLSTAYTGPNARVDRSKTGLGINLQQEVAAGAGLFLRAMNAHSNGETEAFTEADRSLSFGTFLPGALWGRAADHAGLGQARQYASPDRVQYLARGLLGIFTGDGPPPPGLAFHYGAEQVTEAYYNLGLGRGFALTFDLQDIRNPAYNRDRGPIRVQGLRLHWEI